MKQTLESWCTGVINKHKADGARVCIDILEAGLRCGRMSANDVRDVGFSEPNIIGGVFQACANRCGFRKADPRRLDPEPWIVKSIRKEQHGREKPVWILEHRWKAERALRQFENALSGLVDGELKQAEMMLAM